MPIRTDLALLVLRVVTGLTFMVHGHAKLFAMGHEGVTGFFTSLGIPLPGIAAWGVTILEFFGGLALAAGFLTRLLGVLFCIDMVGAIGFALWPKGFMGGFEFELLLGTASIALAFAGGGAYSLDSRLVARAKRADG
ncbi:MAG: DoxX family protein [Gemmatimonadaceae bacterium]|nr:DoxX family protein [Gemmatimonadaceae bacterium]